MRRFVLRTVIALLVGVGLALGLLCLLGGQSASVVAGFEPNRVGRPERGALRTSGGVITVCLGGGCDFDTVQDAVDAASDGDEIRVAAGIYTGVSARAGLTQVVYISKTVTIRGGYATTDWSESNPISTPTTLDAQGQGRVLYVAAGVSPTIEGLRITGGHASQGGGVYIEDAVAVLSDCEIFSNTAQKGAGLYLDDGAATLHGNIVTSNTADPESGCGGGAYVDGGAPSLTKNTFTSNRAKWGGGLYVMRSAAALTDNAVVDNQAYMGAGLCLDDSTADLISNTIAGNHADYGAGFQLLYSEDALRGNRIWANVATRRGGGLYIYESSARLDSNHVYGNGAAYGGGVYVSAGETALTQNLVSDNTATSDGGGLYLEESGSSLDANTVTGNRADRYGGGLYLYYSDAELTNMIVVANQADTAGNALRVYGGSPRLRHMTLVGEQGAPGGDGAGVSVRDSDVQFLNTILVRYGVGVFVEEGAIVSMEGTLWGSGAWANGDNWTGPGDFYQASSITADPAFVDPEAGDYHLQLTSAAVDSGLDARVSTDMDGDPRPIPLGGRFDLGADECRGIDLSGSRKTAAPRHVGVGEAMTYTITLLNSGHLSAANTLLSDAIPTATTYVSQSLHATAGEFGDGDSITWTGTLAPHQPVTLTFAVTVDEEAPIHNTAFLTDAYGEVTRLTAWSNGELYFFPLVLRSY